MWDLRPQGGCWAASQGVDALRPNLGGLTFCPFNHFVKLLLPPLSPHLSRHCLTLGFQLWRENDLCIQHQLCADCQGFAMLHPPRKSPSCRSPCCCTTCSWGHRLLDTSLLLYPTAEHSTGPDLGALISECPGKSTRRLCHNLS